MWKTKLFKFTNSENAIAARAKMDAWLERNRHRIQYQEIFINNAYGVEYRGLTRVY